MAPKQKQPTPENASPSSTCTEQKECLLASYHDLRQSSDDDELEGQQQQHLPSSESRSRRIFTRFYPLVLFFLIVLATSTLLSTLFVNVTQIQSPRGRKFRPLNATQDPSLSFSAWKDCGASPSEARSQDKNCVFDLMLSTWIPRDCYNEEMMNSYLLSGNHTYWYDKDMTQKMPEEEARRGEYKTLWTDAEFHLRHCVYLMDMQLQSYKTGRPIELGIYEHEHTQHCVGLVRGHDLAGKKTKLHARFGRCGFPKDFL